jgi:hypothetical protein
MQMQKSKYAKRKIINVMLKNKYGYLPILPYGKGSDFEMSSGQD